MDERSAISLVAETVSTAGDDAATIDGTVITTDMLHEEADFPSGTTRYTAGWRSVGASLSDIAATGATPTATVAVYAAPTFERTELRDFLMGATDVCGAVDTTYVGGDLDTHREFTVVTTAIGATDDPIGRGGATPGDALCVTGSLGRTAGAMALFDSDPERANDLFRFTPRIAAGRRLAESATAMMDSSDGLARSLHQLADRSDCGFEVEGASVPVHESVQHECENALERAVTYGEDFELVATVPPADVSEIRAALSDVSVIGEVTDEGITMDGEPVPDAGYVHGG